MSVPIAVNAGQPKLGAPHPLFRVSTQDYDVAPGGRKFLLDLIGSQGSKPITLVTNWASELKR